MSLPGIQPLTGEIATAPPRQRQYDHTPPAEEVRATARIPGSEGRRVINATKSSGVDVRASKQMSKPEDGGQSTLSGNGTKSAGQPARTVSTVDFSAGSIDSPQRNFTPTHTSVYVHT